MSRLTVFPENRLNIKHNRVLDAYFAERISKPEYETVKETYTVKAGDHLSKIAKKKKTTVAKLKKDNNLTSNAIKVGDALIVENQKEKGTKVNFKRLNSAHLGDEVYVLVKTDNLHNYTVAINVKQGKTETPELHGNNSSLLLQHDEGESTLAKAKIGAYAHDNSITNKDDFIDWAIFKITLGSKDNKKEQEALEKLPNKKAFLFLLVDAHSPNNIKVAYNGTNPDKNGELDQRSTPNYWLDMDGNWFELKKGCDCGENLNLKFECIRYGTVYGPVYWGSEKLADYKYWGNLIKEKKVTKEEKDILIGMSENEGKLDSIQSYDSEILTIGAMQKTINSEGKGEFPIQVQEFKESNLSKYKELFEDCGWTVEGDTMYYKDPSKSDSSKITGKQLKEKIREGFKSTELKKKHKCKLLEPIARASKDKDFQAKQVEDFISRLKNKVLPIKPQKYNYKLEDYLKSKLGKATVLDHHINRPAYVKPDFGKALDNFFIKKDKEVEEFNKKEKDKTKHKNKVSRNPNDWENNHSTYEKSILDDYGVNRRGTDMKGRYHKMKNKF
ncbi:LysM peptidoglycan-binding domain-containing protein [Tenacibaculum maritimum]|uniref:LysM peptidoglycan-binding domain-containing protein n=2 Tax=Tenacibaculum maritimum TaxID=107401 RepID=UPI001E3DEFF6|nr:LysM peptidoglycan-binding domain-containing protein [Tenacibaculum maritimum]MCD9564247.1 LysM peptidoglycan-binding domain-containing protein [Tenacibaculum maritimum]MCD9566432.1 LysM peptidoglycan-binding domain-containing protein [Tenacibaculum maritimum]MCD9580300.1 LysM peptidoglycan-binding domain-containing protein [Tenacibaculum maritimum]MCD9597128.1 LysM peptidoglycan-binding domain-containing protein [Tenacibaculum maritimum]MCD9614283.1 LysM peptidoglycan-binding domain-contai